MPTKHCTVSLTEITFFIPILSFISSMRYNAFPAKRKRSVSTVTLGEFSKGSLCDRNCHCPLQFVKTSDRFSAFAVFKLTEVFFQ